MGAAAPGLEADAGEDGKRAVTTSRQTSNTTASGPGFSQLSGAGPGRIEDQYTSDNANPNRLVPQAQGYLSNALSGQYLNPATNPHLGALSDSIRSSVFPAVNAQFGRGGRTGSDAHAGTLTGAFTNALAPHLFNQYNTERGFQHSAAGMAGPLDAAGSLPLEQYLERMRSMATLGQKSTQTASPRQTIGGIGLTAAGMFGGGKVPGMGV